MKPTLDMKSLLEKMPPRNLVFEGEVSLLNGLEPPL